MVVQKMEDALKNRVIKLAWLNYNHLGTFIRLVDYMVVETQVRINLESAQLILIEMDREDRKYNLQTTVGFDSSAEDGLKYDPTKIDIENNLEKLLDEMQEVTAEIQRVINHSEFHQFISGLITDSGPRFKTIVEESDDYKETRAKITERIQKDFSYIEEKSKALKNCSKIHEFDQTFDFQAFKAQNSSLEEVKALFDKLQKWEN